MKLLSQVLTAATLFISSNSAFAEPEILDPQLRQRAEALAASTMVGGDGWQVYEEILHADYSRWAMGEIYEGREKFVRSLEAWWDYGMRVSSREIEMIGVDMTDDIAVIRFITTETFVSPDGDAPGFSGYVTNIWVKSEGDWKLLTAEISSLDR